MKPCRHAASTPGCQFCYLYDTSPSCRAHWDGKPVPRRARPAVLVARRPLPCVSLGRVVQRAPCNCPRRDVRICDAGHGEVTQSKQCETCKDYAEE